MCYIKWTGTKCDGKRPQRGLLKSTLCADWYDLGYPLYRNSLNCVFMIYICSVSQHSALKKVLNEDKKSRHRDFEFSKVGYPSTQDSPGVPDSKT